MSRATLAEVDSDFTLRIAYDFPRRRSAFFRRWTNPRDMEVWVWGGIGKDPEASVDLRAGGRYSVARQCGMAPPVGQRLAVPSMMGCTSRLRPAKDAWSIPCIGTLPSATTRTARLRSTRW
jgi:hypothetical protein